MAPSTSARTFTVAEIATQVAGEVIGDGSTSINGVNSLADAGAQEITFISHAKFLKHWLHSKAGAALVSRSIADETTPFGRAIIVVADAEQAMIKVLTMFAPPDDLPEVGVHPSAVIESSAKLGRQVRIGPHVSVSRNVQLGDGVVLAAGVRIYADVEIGAGSVLHSNVVVRERSKIGRSVILHQNVSIGADGFGYRPAPNGAGLLKVPQIGNVILEDGVEIGANSCVDRAKFGSTVIGPGTKIDNLCQIAHNCKIGRCCVFAAGVALAGSVSVGDGVQIGGQAGATDHVSIGSGVKVGGQSGVIRDIPAGATVLGYPAQNGQEVLRQWAAVRKLPELLRKLKVKD